MIAYYFPPLGGSGTLRSLKLAKYLPRFGWSPIVLAPRNPDWYYASDPGLLEELPSSVSIQRSRMLRSAWVYRLLNPLRLPRLDMTLRRYVLQPDEQVGWVPSASRLGKACIRRYGIRAILSSSAPLSCHLIALHLKRATGLPWIADFRDEWYENPHLDLPTTLHRRLHYWLEGRIVREADRVIATSPMFCQLLAKHVARKEKFDTLFMGFDPEDFGPSAGQVRKETGRFVLAFAGMFYSSFRPVALAQALEALVRSGEVRPSSFRLQLIGANTPADLPVNLPAEMIEYTGFLSHREAVGHLAAADALLLLLSHERGPDVIPSKTFEYLGSRKPILALVPPDGAVAQILKRTGGAVVVDIENRDGIQAAVLGLYRAWQRGECMRGSRPEEATAYSEPAQAARLATLLEGLVPPC
jgi:glycosyltransferase involved in cell wall biosynthesis